MSSHRKDLDRWVYFIQETMTHAIKIGSSFYPGSRVQELQTGNAYELVAIGYLFGGRDVEMGFHKRFRKHRLKGEWFSKDIAKDVKKILAERGDPRPPIILADFHESTISVDEFAGRCGVGVATVNEWVVDNSLPCVKGSRGRMLDRVALQVFAADGMKFTDDDEMRELLLGTNKKKKEPEGVLLF